MIRNVGIIINIIKDRFLLLKTLHPHDQYKTLFFILLVID